MTKGVEVSEETWLRLQKAAVPLVDTVDDVIRRALDALGGSGSMSPANGENRPPRADPPITRQQMGRGQKTRQEEYRLPILQALASLGGRGSINDVLQRVRLSMEGRLNEFDLEMLESGRDFRWRNTAMWERKRMVSEGLLRGDSQVGIWELTEDGKREVKS